MTSEPLPIRETPSPSGTPLSPRVKKILPSWVHEHLGDTSFRSLYDPFAGEGQVARYFKRLGKQVFAGDLLEGHYCFTSALIANNDLRISAERLASWQQVIRDPQVATRYASWAHRYFTPEETIWLGIWNAHLAAPDLHAHERALGATAVAYTMRYWRSFALGTPFKKPLPPLGVFQHYVETLNAWVFNNGLVNQALWGDAYQQAPRVEAELLFCYPPTHLGFHNCSDGMALFEAWVKGDPDLRLPGQIEMIPGPPTLGMPLGTSKFYKEALRRFMARCTHIPTWVVAFHDRYPLNETEFADLISEFKTILKRPSVAVWDDTLGTPLRENLIIAR
ncbi:MAG: DNA adenine methylase [Candidatus Sericytochromatia bacterium]|nr:DNA adenine methylase [Candidatus Sericytochromatia bacterium]